MSTNILIRHCAPTLAGLKLASLFTCDFHTRRDLEKTLAHYNIQLNQTLESTKIEDLFPVQNKRNCLNHRK